MKTITLVTRATPSAEEVQQFVEAIPGGFWDADSPLSEGTVNRPEGTVYISYDPGFGGYSEEVLQDTDQKLPEVLGHPPHVALHLHLSVSGKSSEIAEEVANAALARWGGVLVQ